MTVRKTWRCIQGCGACCYLADRPELDQFLAPDEVAQYNSLISADGWCVHFQPSTRQCRIYDQRPYFCRVEPEVFDVLYGVTLDEFDEFAIACCEEHIADIHGPASAELRAFHYQVAGTDQL